MKIGLSLMSCLLLVSGVSHASQLTLDVSPVNNTLKADTKQSVWIRVGLKGNKQETNRKRAAANVAIVLDKSGSMNGDKMNQAKSAAIDAVRLLNKDDIVSVVTYDSTVNVVVPATKLSDPQSVIAKIRSIEAKGNTALFAGVSKGAAEVRKFLDRKRVNRVILLSDGLANVGPSSPGELGNLGKSLQKENISVSTLGLGLGYNEDLMLKLASSSGGNHRFIEKASELADIFRDEFNDVLSVVAQEIDIYIDVPAGIRPVRVLGNEADINGQQIVTRLAQVYSEQERYVAVQVEIPATEEASKLTLATVGVTYANMKTHKSDKLSGAAKVRFSSDGKQVKDSVNRSALADVVSLVSSENNKLATRYLDLGNLEACRQVLRDNVTYLNANATNLPADKDRLTALATQNFVQLKDLEGVVSNKDERANRSRKNQRGYQSLVDQQQRGGTKLPVKGGK